MAEKQRIEINDALKWDFSDIFESDAAWETAYTEAEAAIGGLDSIRGTLGNSVKAMKSGLDRLFSVSEQIEHVFLYAMLRKNVDNGDATYQTMYGKAMNLHVAFSTACAFLDPEILSIAPEKLVEMMNNPALANYRHMLENTDRMRAHTRDTETERLLAMLSDAIQTPSDCFNMLESVDMTFPEITDEDGEPAPLTHGSFGVYRESTNARVRREAFEKYFGEFQKYRNTFAALYAGNVKTDNFLAQVRNYASACEQALFDDNAPLEVYDRLIEAVHGGLPTMRRYLELRRRILGLDQLTMCDLYCPIVEGVDMKIPYEEAKKLVRDACKPLGKGYQELLDRAYSERWIDVYETRGKTTGAYSCGVYGAHPYVLLNYADTLDDVFTLAHELGHAMHSYLSNQKQDYANHSYRILVAEVASTVNEVLLTRHLLSIETNPARRAYILNHFLEGFRTTVFRQTLFAEFEQQAHDLQMSGTPLTAELLTDIFGKLNALYYDGVEQSDLHNIEWARIPHFYNAFYVYQYATGFSSAVSIAKSILEDNGAAAYLEFLSTGGSDYPLEELKIAGLDLTKPDAVASALAEFDVSLSALEALL